MIKYYCNTCKTYISKSLVDEQTNKCIVCRTRLEEAEKKKQKDNKYNDQYQQIREEYNNEYVKPEISIFWDDHNQTPSFFCADNEKLSSDIRPVFPEEQLLIDILTDYKFEILNKNVWFSSSKGYLVNGKKIDVKRKEMFTKDPISVRKEFEKNKNEIDYEIFNENMKRFISANEQRLHNITEKALRGIKENASEFTSDSMFISFSGGKDSTVVDDLVKRALPHQNVVKIFGDTTLEFPETYTYVNRVKKDPYNKEFSRLLSTSNKRDNFYDLCDVIGPPSRVMRWCCTYFKTTPISDRIDRLFKSKKRILTFYGIRRNESASRSKYEALSESPKIAKQLVYAPIIDWFDFDVWLYIIGNNVDFNDAYRNGYSRVGCWNCPNNSDWAMFLSKIFHPEESKQWRNLLIDFAMKTNKEDPVSYVDENQWKARQGGKGLDISNNTLLVAETCVMEDNTFNYLLTKPLDKTIYEFFKPFGKLDFENGNSRKGEVYVISKNGIPALKLVGRIGHSQLKVTVLNFREMGGISKKIKNISQAKVKIDCQMMKYQTCIACFGCKSVCKFDAISMTSFTQKDQKTGNHIVSVDYHIDENKCTQCGMCIDHYDAGCYMKKVLRIRKDS